MFGSAPFVADIDARKRAPALSAAARRPHSIRPIQARARNC
jgi:hypothetical protein